MRKIKFLMIFISILIFVVMTMGLNAFALEVNSKSAILVDTKTNTVIYQKNINDSISPGAFTKLMTGNCSYGKQ